MKQLFLRGDSISLHYGDYLKTLLTPKFDCLGRTGKELAFQDLDNPMGDNGGDSRQILQFIQQMETEKRIDFDIFVFNCGLHDIKRSKENGQLQIGIHEYEKNLQSTIDIVSRYGVQILWINTTPVDDENHNSRGLSWNRYNDDVLAVNQCAKKVMDLNHIPSIDLYTFTQCLGRDIYCDHVHYRENIRYLQAAYLAGSIIQAVNDSPIRHV